MAYKVIFDKKAAKVLDRFEKRNKYLFKRIYCEINALSDNLFGGKSLIGDKKGYFSLRVGDYRIIYSINHSTFQIYILDISHRKEVYK